MLVEGAVDKDSLPLGVAQRVALDSEEGEDAGEMSARFGVKVFEAHRQQLRSWVHLQRGGEISRKRARASEKGRG